MTRWLVSLTGAEKDLERLIEWPDGKDWQIIRHEKWGVVLCSERFETVENYESVSYIADALIAHINRSARYRALDFQGVSRSKIVEQRQNRDHVIVPLGLVVEHNTAGGIGWVKHAPDGTVIETTEDVARKKQASGFDRLVRLQEAYPDLADALRYLAEEPGMYGFYKVGEAILRAIGKPKKWNELVRRGWTSNDDLWRFTRSTHVQRHHHSAKPDRPMTVREAEAYIRELLDKLIADLDSTTP